MLKRLSATVGIFVVAILATAPAFTAGPSVPLPDNGVCGGVLNELAEMRRLKQAKAQGRIPIQNLDELDRAEQRIRDLERSASATNRGTPAIPDRLAGELARFESLGKRTGDAAPSTPAKVATDAERPAPVSFYGGSFDPPTKGHIAIMRKALERDPEGELYVLVNSTRGEKDYFTSFEQRAEFIRKSLGEELARRVKIVPDREQGYEKLARQLSENHSEVRTYVGDDVSGRADFRALDGNVRTVVVARPGTEGRILDNMERLMLEPEFDGVSSSRARALIAEGNFEGLASVIDPAVAKIIEEKGLYVAPKGEALAKRQADYEKAFAEFRAANPGAKELSPPPFKAAQDPAAWEDKFAKALREKEHPGTSRSVVERERATDPAERARIAARDARLNSSPPDLFKDKNANWHTRADAEAANRAVLDDLANLPHEQRLPNRKAGLSREERSALYDKVANNPVAALCKVDKYDPQGTGIGYCFGRAMTVHFQALLDGLQKEDIRKMWALGDFRAGGTQWRYHVATAVRGSDHQWYAIDPIMGRVLSVEQWRREMLGYNDPAMRIYVTEAKRFGPGAYIDSAGREVIAKYSKQTWDEATVGRYQKDLLDHFREEARALGARARADGVPPALADGPARANVAASVAETAPSFNSFRAVRDIEAEAPPPRPRGETSRSVVAQEQPPRTSNGVSASRNVLVYEADLTRVGPETVQGLRDAVARFQNSPSEKLEVFIVPSRGSERATEAQRKKAMAQLAGLAEARFPDPELTKAISGKPFAESVELLASRNRGRSVTVFSDPSAVNEPWFGKLRGENVRYAVAHELGDAEGGLVAQAAKLRAKGKVDFVETGARMRLSATELADRAETTLAPRAASGGPNDLRAFSLELAGQSYADWQKSHNAAVSAVEAALKTVSEEAESHTAIKGLLSELRSVQKAKDSAVGALGELARDGKPTNAKRLAEAMESLADAQNRTATTMQNLRRKPPNSEARAALAAADRALDIARGQAETTRANVKSPGSLAEMAGRALEELKHAHSSAQDGQQALFEATQYGSKAREAVSRVELALTEGDRALADALLVQREALAAPTPSAGKRLAAAVEKVEAAEGRAQAALAEAAGSFATDRARVAANALEQDLSAARDQSHLASRSARKISEADAPPSRSLASREPQLDPDELVGFQLTKEVRRLEETLATDPEALRRQGEELLALRAARERRGSLEPGLQARYEALELRNVRMWSHLVPNDIDGADFALNTRLYSTMAEGEKRAWLIEVADSRHPLADKFFAEQVNQKPGNTLTQKFLRDIAAHRGIAVNSDFVKKAHLSELSVPNTASHLPNYVRSELRNYADQEIEKLLQSRNATVRENAALAGLPGRDPKFLAKLTSHSDPEVALLATKAFERDTSRAAHEGLLRALKSPHEHVRLEAARLLQPFNDLRSVRAAAEAVGTAKLREHRFFNFFELDRKIELIEPKARSSAYANLPDETFLERVLGSPRAAAVNALSELPYRHPDVAYGLLRHDDPSVRKAVADKLFFRSTSNRQAVLTLLDDKVAEVRYAAMNALDGPNFAKERLPLLKKLAWQDEDYAVRTEALRRLNSAGDPQLGVRYHEPRMWMHDRFVADLRAAAGDVPILEQDLGPMALAKKIYDFPELEGSAAKSGKDLANQLDAVIATTPPGYVLTSGSSDFDVGLKWGKYQPETGPGFNPSVFAVGGTQTAGDIFADATLGRLQARSRAYAELVEEVLREARETNNPIVITGHSLGGGMAQMLGHDVIAALAKEKGLENALARVRVVSFNGFGATEPLKMLGRYDPEIASRMKMAAYRVTGDPVSGIGTVLGGNKRTIEIKRLPYFGLAEAHFMDTVIGSMLSEGALKATKNKGWGIVPVVNASKLVAGRAEKIQAARVEKVRSEMFERLLEARNITIRESEAGRIHPHFRWFDAELRRLASNADPELRATLEGKIRDMESSARSDVAAKQRPAAPVAIARGREQPHELQAAGNTVHYDSNISRDTQREIWNGLEQGDRQETEARIARLAAKMETGQVTKSEEVGLGLSRPKKLTLDDGTTGIWKPYRAHLGDTPDGFRTANGASELAAYRVDRQLGLNAVPVTVERDFEGKHGTMQTWVEGGRLGTEGSPEQLRLFDHLINEPDRNGPNYLRANNRIVAIDHGGSFGDMGRGLFPTQVQGVLRDLRESRIGPEEAASRLRPILDARVVENLRTTTVEKWREILGGLLDQEQFGNFLSRRDEIVHLADEVRNAVGEKAFRHHGAPTGTSFSVVAREIDHGERAVTTVRAAIQSLPATGPARGSMLDTLANLERWQKLETRVAAFREADRSLGQARGAAALREREYAALVREQDEAHAAASASARAARKAAPEGTPARVAAEIAEQEVARLASSSLAEASRSVVAQENLRAGVKEVLTTQTVIGGQQVFDTLHDLGRRSSSFDDLLKEVGQMTERRLSAVRGPDLAGGTGSKLYLLDGHHHARALYELAYGPYDDLPKSLRNVMKKSDQETLRKKFAEDPRYQLKLDVTHTYATREELATDFARSGNGLLPETVERNPAYSRALAKARDGAELESADQRALVAAYRKAVLPVAELQNDPVRSAIGKAFDAEELVVNTRNYSQFLFARGQSAEEIRALGITDRNAFSPRVQEGLRRIMFDDPDGLQALRDLAKEGNDPRGRPYRTLNDRAIDRALAKRRGTPSYQVARTIDEGFQVDAPARIFGKAEIPKRELSQERLETMARIWREARPDDGFRDSVNQAAYNGRVTNAFASDLKDFRARLKAARWLCEATCEKPDRMEALTRLSGKVGELADAARYGTKEQVKAEARLLGRLLREGELAEVDKDFKRMEAVSRSEVAKRVEKASDRVRDALGRDRLDEERLRHFRRDVGMLNMLSLFDAANPRAGARDAQAFRALRDEYDRIGKLHDNMVREIFDGKEATPARLSAETRARVLKAADFYDRGAEASRSIASREAPTAESLLRAPSVPVRDPRALGELEWQKVAGREVAFRAQAEGSRVFVREAGEIREYRGAAANGLISHYLAQAPLDPEMKNYRIASELRPEGHYFRLELDGSYKPRWEADAEDVRHEYMSYALTKGNETWAKRLGFARRELPDGKMEVSLPSPETMTRNLETAGREPPVRFVSYEQGFIPEEKWVEFLGEGKALLGTRGYYWHDVDLHGVGFLELAERPEWPRVKEFSRRLTELREAPQPLPKEQIDRVMTEWVQVVEHGSSDVPLLRHRADELRAAGRAEEALRVEAEEIPKVWRKLDDALPDYERRIASLEARAGITRETSRAVVAEEKLPSHIGKGTAEARQIGELVDELRARKIDPRRTHVSEFASQVRGLLTYADDAIHGQDPGGWAKLKGKLPFGTNDQVERLKLLESFTEEAERRISAKEVTYEWWNEFNHRVSILITPTDKRSTEIAGVVNPFQKALTEGKPPAWHTNEGYQRVAEQLRQQDRERGYRGLAAHNVADHFPEFAVLPVTNGDFGLAALNDLYGRGVAIKGHVAKPLQADGHVMWGDRFFVHDGGHASAMKDAAYRNDLKPRDLADLREHYLAYRRTLEGERRETFEFAYFLVTHEHNSPADFYSGYARFGNDAESVKRVLDEAWFKGSVPSWASKDAASAKKFLAEVDKEIRGFSESYAEARASGRLDLVKYTGPVDGNGARPVLVDGKLVKDLKSQRYQTLYHGFSQLDPKEVLEKGLARRGDNWDLADHAEERGSKTSVFQKGETAFRGTTEQAITYAGDGEQSGAAVWARAGGYVVEIRGFHGWDLNSALEGRVKRADGTFRGNLFTGEHEISIPAHVPPEFIYRIIPVKASQRNESLVMLDTANAIMNPRFTGKAPVESGERRLASASVVKEERSSIPLAKLPVEGQGFRVSKGRDGAFEKVDIRWTDHAAVTVPLGRAQLLPNPDYIGKFDTAAVGPYIGPRFFVTDAEPGRAFVVRLKAPDGVYEAELSTQRSSELVGLRATDFTKVNDPATRLDSWPTEVRSLSLSPKDGANARLQLLGDVDMTLNPSAADLKGEKLVPNLFSAQARENPGKFTREEIDTFTKAYAGLRREENISYAQDVAERGPDAVKRELAKFGLESMPLRKDGPVSFKEFASHFTGGNRKLTIPSELGQFAAAHGENPHALQLLAVLHGLPGEEQTRFVDTLRKVLSPEDPSSWVIWSGLFDGFRGDGPHSPSWWKHVTPAPATVAAHEPVRYLSPLIPPAPPPPVAPRESIATLSERAVASQNRSVIHFDRGVELDGKVTQLLLDEKGAPYYVRLEGPTSVRERLADRAARVIPGQDEARHGTGYSTPIGDFKVQGTPHTSASLDTKSLAELKGKDVTLTYDSGIKVVGKLDTAVTDAAGRPILLTLNETDVLTADGTKLYQKEWGPFDLVVSKDVRGLGVRKDPAREPAFAAVSGKPTPDFLVGRAVVRDERVVVPGEPGRITRARYTSLERRNPAAALGYDKVHEELEALAYYRERFLLADGKIRNGSELRELDAANSRYGLNAAPVLGGSEDARRIGYLKQHLRWLEAEAEHAAAEGAGERLAKIERQQAAFGTELAAAIEARARAAAKDPRASRRASIEAFANDELARRYGVTSDRTDPLQAKLLGSRLAQDQAFDARLVRSAEGYAAKAFRKAFARDDAEAARYARELVETRSAMRETSLAGDLRDGLKKRGWDQKRIEACFEEHVCAAESLVREMPMPELARARYEAELARAPARDRAEAAALARTVTSNRSLKEELAEKATRADLLANEARELRNRASKAPDARARNQHIDSAIQADRARERVFGEISALQAKAERLRAAAGASVAEEKLADKAVARVAEFLSRPTARKEIARIKGLEELAKPSGNKLEDFSAFRKKLSELPPADFARAVEVVSGRPASAAPRLEKALKEVEEVHALVGDNPALAREALKGNSLKPEERALAEALGATKSQTPVGKFERDALARVGIAKAEAEVAKLREPTRSVAAAEDPAERVRKLPALGEKEREELATAIKDSGKDSPALLARAEALAKSDPDTFESWRASLVHYHEARKTMDEDAAWEQGVRRMLKDLYGDDAKKVDELYAKTAPCLKRL